MRFLVILITFFCVVACTSCGDDNKLAKYPILKVSLEEKEISIYDIFKEVVIIPLETTENSSFRYLEKVKIYNDTVYVFDSSLNSLYFFAADGGFIDKICQIGQGPGEYIMVYDFLINDNEKTIELLNPMGSIHKYGMDGVFVGQDDLPKPPMNYRNFELLDENHYATWSSLIAIRGI